MSWRSVKIGQLAEFINGYAFKPSDWGDSGLKIIRIQNLSNPNKEYNRTELKLDDRYLVQRGDLLISWSATLDVFEWQDELALLNQHIFKVVPNDQLLDKAYFRYGIKVLIKRVEQKLRGSTMKHINRGDFLDLAIPLPPLAIQKKIAAVLEKADELRRKREEQIKRLDDLLQATFLDMFGDPVTNPKGWERIRLGKIVQSRLGKMLDKKKNNGLNKKKYLANFNVKWDEFDFSDLREMDFEPQEQVEFSLKAGDLLVCEGGEIARCAIWKEELQDCYFQKALHRVRCDPSFILPEYLQKCFWFTAKNGGFSSIISTATISHLTGVKLKQLQIPIPPLEMQKNYFEKSKKIRNMNLRLHSIVKNEKHLFNSLMQRAFKGELDLK
jgi:type I restriction enzyme S subunit